MALIIQAFRDAVDYESSLAALGKALERARLFWERQQTIHEYPNVLLMRCAVDEIKWRVMNWARRMWRKLK